MAGSTTLDPPRVEAAPAPPFVPGLQLIRLLARGGFAEVWEAEQTSLDRRVAVKILRSEHLGQEQTVQLFEQEARVLARLNHPNVVQVIDRGKSPQGPYFVMEYIEGETLQDMLSRGTISRERALTILLHSVRGLAYAHRNHVIHRDVKPANILVSRRGQVKIGDFGIAAVRRAAQPDAEDGNGSGPALGTRAFMAPEQREAFDKVGTQADVYSLGVILHRIITGKLPAGPGQAAAGVRIPERLLPIVLKALAASPDDRYRTAEEFREALINALEGRHLEAHDKSGADNVLGAGGRFELLDVIRQDDRRSVYLVRKGGPEGERIVVKRYTKDAEALRTARTIIRLQHPHIVRIHAVGEREDSFIMLMEHLPGGDLRERLVRPHAWQEVVRVGQQVALALACAAKHDIVHGNVRPSNILFEANGNIRVSDFGLPEHYVGDAGKRNWYAPPEGGRSKQGDLYALGAVLYEMLFASAVPENGLSHLEDQRRIHDVPEGLVQVIRRLLAPVNERYEIPEHVAGELGQLLEVEQARVEAAARAADAAVAQVEEPRGSIGGWLMPGAVGFALGALAMWVVQRLIG